MPVLLRTLIFTLVVPGTATVYVPAFLLYRTGKLGWPELGIATLLGMTSIAIGFAMYCWCAWDFAERGGGTPAPIDAPKQLVVHGLYRHVRNPMYVAVMFVLLGEGVVFRSLGLVVYAGVFWVMFHTFVTRYEEPHLRDVFGDAYTEYRRRVPRWLPRFRPQI